LRFRRARRLLRTQEVLAVADDDGTRHKRIDGVIVDVPARHARHIAPVRARLIRQHLLRRGVRQTLAVDGVVQHVAAVRLKLACGGL
jgi:hypothetical protein